MTSIATIYTLNDSLTFDVELIKHVTAVLGPVNDTCHFLDHSLHEENLETLHLHAKTQYHARYGAISRFIMNTSISIKAFQSCPEHNFETLGTILATWHHMRSSKMENSHHHQER